ncbi:MAG: universal stress protein [Anaerolineales bacterium]
MNILVYVNRLPRAEPAVLLGSVIARQMRAPITLLHVYRREDKQALGESVLKEARELLPADLTAQAQLRCGNPLKHILAEVGAGQHDLVVLMASRRRVLRGSLPTDHAMLQRARSSVLVVKQAPKDLKRILICTGGLEEYENVIKAGGEFARAVNAQATLLHVTSPVPSMYTGLEEIEETLEEMLTTDTPVARHLRNGAEILSEYGLKAEVKLRHGVAVDEIIRETQKSNYDMIILGASGASDGFREWLMGNVTQRVVDQASSPVLVISRPKTRNQGGK